MCFLHNRATINILSISFFDVLTLCLYDVLPRIINLNYNKFPPVPGLSFDQMIMKVIWGFTQSIKSASSPVAPFSFFTLLALCGLLLNYRIMFLNDCFHKRSQIRCRSRAEENHWGHCSSGFNSMSDYTLKSLGKNSSRQTMCCER